MIRPQARSSLAWLPGFAVLSAVWGSSFALIKVAVDAGVPPPWVALARCALGTVTLLGICAVTRSPLPRERATWGHAAVVAVFANTVPFVLLAYGEQHVDSVLAGLRSPRPVTYVIPVWSTAIGAVLLGEPVGWNTVAGGVLVVAGVLVTRAPQTR